MARLRLNGKGAGSYFSAPKKGIQFIHSGSKLLDLALGGGWAEGRIANIVGDKSTGKTLLAIEASSNFFIKYGSKKARVRYREAEAAFDEPYAAALGMPVDLVDFGDEKIDTVEQLFDDLQRVIKGAKYPELYIVDSLDAISDEAELERDMNKGSYGTQKARNLSQMFRRITRDLAEKNITLLIISQVRSKIGMSFGRNTTRSGGRALDFYASQVAYAQHVGKISQTVRKQKRAVGVEIKVQVDKNKISLPFREAAFSIMFGFGIDDASSCIEWLGSVGEIKNVKAALDKLDKMNDRQYRDEVEALHMDVEEVWRELDERLLPTRSKYGVIT